MQQQLKKIPEWNAPDTLVARIMNAIESGRAQSNFFTWPFIHRLLFCFAVLSAISYVFIINSSLLELRNISIVLMFSEQISTWYSITVSARQIFLGLVSNLIGNPLFLLIFISSCSLITLTWAGCVRILCYVIGLQQRRIYNENPA